jgi:hypothetical protein
MFFGIMILGIASGARQGGLKEMIYLHIQNIFNPHISQI